MSQVLIIFIIQKPTQNQKCFINLINDSNLMNYIEYIILYRIKILTEYQPFLFELFKPIKFINQPSHDENKTLSFTDQLVGHIDIA